MVERPFGWAVLRNRNTRVTIGDKEPQSGDDENILTGTIFNHIDKKREIMRKMNHELMFLNQHLGEDFQYRNIILKQDAVYKGSDS